MNIHFMSVCERLRHETDPDRFWETAKEALAHYGVNSLLYTAIAFQRETLHQQVSKAAFIKSSHSIEYMEMFEGRVLDDDWTLDYCLQNTDILVWHTETQWHDASPMQKKRALIERDLNLFKGVSVPASRFGPGLIGGVGLSMADVPLKEFEAHWAECGTDILAICGVLDAGMRGQHLGSVVGLSPREIDCLSWLAAGFRPDQIAERLAISRSSVDKYLVKARIKLRSGTLEQATAKAILFNLIQP